MKFKNFYEIYFPIFDIGSQVKMQVAQSTKQTVKIQSPHLSPPHNFY